MCAKQGFVSKSGKRERARESQRKPNRAKESHRRPERARDSQREPERVRDIQRERERTNQSLGIKIMISGERATGRDVWMVPQVLKYLKEILY